MDQERAIQEAAERIATAEYCTALVGAGISKESGIPTFRGEGGLWTRLGEPPMNGYQLFLEDPHGWWLDRLAQLRNPPEFAQAIAEVQALEHLESDGGFAFHGNHQHDAARQCSFAGAGSRGKAHFSSSAWLGFWQMRERTILLSRL